MSNSWNRQYLDAPVNATGYTYLRTHYYGDDWIFHTRLVVRIGDNIIESAEIPTYSDDNNTHAGSGSIWESLDLTDDRDNGIFEAIANAEAVPIMVRYEGEHYHTYNLSARDRQALKDSYDLARLLSK